MDSMHAVSYSWGGIDTRSIYPTTPLLSFCCLVMQPTIAHESVVLCFMTKRTPNPQTCEVKPPVDGSFLLFRKSLALSDLVDLRQEHSALGLRPPEL